MFVTVPADRYSSPPLTVPLRLGDRAVVQAAVLSHRRAADLLLLEIDAGEGRVVLPQVRASGDARSGSRDHSQVRR